MIHTAPLDSMSAARDLREQLKRLTAAITHSASLVPPAAAVVEVVRALDVRCFDILRVRRSGGEDVHGPDALWYTPDRAPWFGASRAFSILLHRRVAEADEAFVIRGESGAEWAQDVLQGCETIARIEHWLNHHAAGYAVVDRDPAGFVIRARHSPLAVEAVEREEVQALDAFTRRAHSDEVERLRAARPYILSELEARLTLRNGVADVQPTPEIAAHYERSGLLTAQRMWSDQDTFDGETLLGGEPFNLYRGATGILIGLALRHIDLVDIVIRRDPAARVRSLLTVAGPASGLATRIAAHLGTELREARHALECLTLAAAATETYGAWPAPPPPLVQVARDQVAWSIAGTLAAPLEFLLTQLRLRYRSDWDSAVDSREGRFRAEMYSFFVGVAPDRFVVSDRTVALREGGRVLTDVDALIFDRHTGDLALFQLKWQDAPGFVGTRLASGRRNFLTSTATWAARLRAWLSARTTRDAARALGLTPSDAEAVTGVHVFVLGRNFAHFSDAEPEDTGIAWATWPQVINRIAELIESASWRASPLRLLHERLRADLPHRRATPVVYSATLKIGSVSVRIEPLGDQQVA